MTGTVYIPNPNPLPQSLRNPRLLLPLPDCALGRDEQPANRDQNPHPTSDSQRTCAAHAGLQNGTGDEAAEEEGDDGEDFVIASDDHAADVEEFGVGDKFTPDGGQDN